MTKNKRKAGGKKPFPRHDLHPAKNSAQVRSLRQRGRQNVNQVANWMKSTTRMAKGILVARIASKLALI